MGVKGIEMVNVWRAREAAAFQNDGVLAADRDAMVPPKSWRTGATGVLLHGSSAQRWS